MKFFIKSSLGILFLALLVLSSCRNPDNKIEPTCFDGVLNQDEERIDCGGPNCPPCADSCDDFVQNQDEQSPVTAFNPNVRGIDCGGENCPPCSTCDDGIQNSHWVYDPNLTPDDIGKPGIGKGLDGRLYRLIKEKGIDCGFPCPEVCDPTPFDGIQNGDEEGVDCGGTHPDSPPCPPASCSDGIQNGTETGIDCGDLEGYCPDCPDPTCDDGIQNIHIEYTDAIPAGYIVVIEDGIDCSNHPLSSCPDCPQPTCWDGIKNGDETGIDCGGSCHTLCDPQPNCNNGIKDGLETGVDCGGPDCPPCPTCNDGIKNGPELKVDCVDYPINHPDWVDCPVCPSCHDGIHNQGDDDLFELDVDCGGPNCEPCEQFVTIASIGIGTGGSSFRDQYSWNKLKAQSGITDTLSLDHNQYPGFKVTRVNNFGGGSNVGSYIKIVANQGIDLGAENTLIRTVTLFLPVPESDPEYNLNIPIDLLNMTAPDFATYTSCLPLMPNDVSVPFITYQEKLIQNNQADKCFRSYKEQNDVSRLTYTYHFGGVTSLGYYMKGSINQGKMRTGNNPQTGTKMEGSFNNLEFKAQYPLF